MRHVLTGFGVLLSLVLVGISATLSFLFMRTLGGTPEEGLAYGAIGVTLELLKCLVPFFVAWRWRERNVAALAGAGLLWLAAVAVSLTSAAGLASQNRMGKSASFETMQAQFVDGSQELAAVLERQRDKPHDRSSQEVDAALQATLAQPLRPSSGRTRTLNELSSGCTKPDKLTGDLCVTVGRLRQELASAVEWERLEGQATTLRSKLDVLRSRGAGEGGEGDRQAGVISRIVTMVTGWSTSVDAVQVALVALMALALEIGSTCGLYAALGNHGLGLVEGAKARSAVPESEPADEVKPGELVERFCAARIVPGDGAGVTTQELFASFFEWCRVQRQEPLPRTVFLAEFRVLAERLSIAFENGAYRGVVIDAHLAETEARQFERQPLTSGRTVPRLT